MSAGRLMTRFGAPAWLILVVCVWASCAQGIEPRTDTGDTFDFSDLGSDGLPDAQPPDSGDPDLDASPEDTDTPDTTGEVGPDVVPDAQPDQPVVHPVLVEAGDWPDCLNETDCPSHAHEFTGFTIELEAATGQILFGGERYAMLEGRIEAPGSHPFGYDADFIGIRAPARTIVEITIGPSSSASPIDPHVTTFDGGKATGGPAFREITANGDRASGEVTARTMVASPYADAPFFVWIDDERNWQGEAPIGDTTYAYRVRFVTSGFFPIDVDVSAGAVTQPGFVDLATAGDMHFYRFTAPGAWRVVFETTNSDFAGALLGFDTQGGELRPFGLAGDEVGGTPVTLTSAGFLTQDNEHVFGVTDWFGRGTSLTGTPFDYTLTLEPESGKAR